MTLLLGAVSADGPVVVADGLTTGLSTGDALQEVKVASIAADSSLVVMVAGRATFGGVTAIDVCLEVVNSALVVPTAVDELARILREHFLLERAVPGEPESIEIVCVGPGSDRGFMTVACCPISFVGPRAPIPVAAQQLFLSAGDSEAQELALEFIEHQVEAVPSPDEIGPPRLQASIAALASQSAEYVAGLMSEAIEWVTAAQSSAGGPITVGGRPTALLIDHSGAVRAIA